MRPGGTSWLIPVRHDRNEFFVGAAGHTGGHSAGKPCKFSGKSGKGTIGTVMQNTELDSELLSSGAMRDEDMVDPPGLGIDDDDDTGDAKADGRGNDDDPHPKVVEALRGQRVAVAVASDCFSLCVLESGRAFGWGYGGDPALGLGLQKDQRTPLAFSHRCALDSSESFISL